ncbi:ATP-binding protein [Streptomyces lasalocidi]
MTTSGHPQALPRGVDRAAYRIVQEALTNVVKHARTGHARATVAYAPGEVALTVVDAGAKPHDHPDHRGPRPDRHEGTGRPLRRRGPQPARSPRTAFA